MTTETTLTVVEVLREIAADMERDAMTFEGAPFNGRTVGTQFGNQGAAIAALANIVREQHEQIQKLKATSEGHA